MRRYFAGGELRVLATLTCGALLVAGCGDAGSTSGPSDAASDGADTETIGACLTDGLELGRAELHADPLNARPGEVRVGKLKKSDLPVDRAGLSTVAEGDYVMANSNIAVIIEPVGRSERYDPWGGKIVGLARVSGGKLIEAADFDEAFLGVGRHSVKAETVTVLRDGKDGKVVIRTIGLLTPLPFVDELAKFLAPGEYGDLRVALDWSLEKDAHSFEAQMTFDVTSLEPIDVRVALHGFFQAYRMPRWVPTGLGFDTRDPRSTPVPYFSFISEKATSYAWSVPGELLRPFFATTGFDSFQSDAYVLPPCKQTTKTMARVTVGGPGLNNLLRVVRKERSEKEVELAGKVTGSATAIAFSRVHAATPDGRHLTRATADKEGRFALHVKAGEDVQLFAYQDGLPLGNALKLGPVSADKRDVSVALPTAATINFVPKSGEIFGARVKITPVKPMTLAPPSFGERPTPSKPGPVPTWSHLRYLADGKGSVLAAAGDYDVVISRGTSHEIDVRRVTVAGETPVDVAYELAKTVNDDNLLCGDGHVHTERSPDSGDGVDKTLDALMGEGVDWAMRTEHEWVSSFEPDISRRGLSDRLLGLTSMELTTFSWGHFNLLGIVPDPTLPGQGAYEWAGKRPPEVFDEVRKRFPAATIIVNHPRLPSFAGYFGYVRFDPETAKARNPDAFDDKLNVIEVFNASDFESNRTESVRDWLSLLSSGKKIAATGTSDVHGVESEDDVPAYPRTCVRLPKPARKVGALAIEQAIASGRSIVSGGALVSLTGPTGKGAGETEKMSGDSIVVNLEVQAPSWVALERLELIVDGKTIETIPLTGSSAIRFTGTRSVKIAGTKGYVIAVVHGKPMAPVHPENKAFAVTNPLYLER